MAIASLLKVAFLINLIIFLPLLVFVSSDSKIPKDNNQVLDHTHHDNSSTPFPPNFLFGTSSSAYQFEGAYLSDGKGLNNWDVYTHKPGKITDGSNGDVAVDQYHLYLEDTDLMSNLGVNSYRFSISWARILPKGRFGDINKAGIRYYNKLIDALLRQGIQPFVTLSHNDLPQELEEKYGGWLSPKSQKDFRYYADICFERFGDRVKYWTTLNEPNLLALYGYRTGEFPPGRCSSPFGNCTQGDAEKEPFIAAHNMILAHASAVDVYRTKYQKKQGGRIGIVLHCLWFEPLNNSTADKLAAERAQDFIMNWFLDPIIFGNYPAEMKKILGSNLPEFSSNDMKKLKKGLDFIGINHYTSFYMEDCIYSLCKSGQGITWTEGFARWSQQKDGVPLGKVSEVGWLQIYPLGMEKIVTYLKERYHNTPMIITENGCAQMSKPNNSIEDFVNDKERVEYMSGYLDALMRAMRQGADVRGYFAWSLLDNFEWNDGYTQRFGLHHVDFTTLKRTPRLSATWYKKYIAKYYKVVPEKR